MKNKITEYKDMKPFLLLWATQAFSALGSGVTSYALVLWAYGQTGSALKTALLMVSTYTPYVLFSIFAGALCDRWNKRKTMLVCDSIAAGITVVTLLLIKTGNLEIWHLYLLNAVSGLMNTVQQPASEVATTALLKPEQYQRAGGLKALSNSISSILTPIIATAIYGLGGMDSIILFDLVTFAAAFFTLFFFIPVPEVKTEAKEESLVRSAAEGLRWLRAHRGIYGLMLYLAAINLVAMACEAALPAMLLSVKNGGERVLGTINAVIGIATLCGSLLASALKPPKSRVRVIFDTLFISMSTENFLLAFSREPIVWYIGGFLGWILIPIMNTNLNTVFRLGIPAEIQGRVYAARNSFQFFTIPLGYLLGGLLVDEVFEPFIALQQNSLWNSLFGSGKGSGAAMFLAILGFAGMFVALIFRANRHIWALEKENEKI